MRQLDANLFEVTCDAIVITTNGFVKKDGTAVMGRGVAREAARRWPVLPGLLGEILKSAGNHVTWLLGPPEVPINVVTMPVKVDWFTPALPDLIRRSCEELMALADRQSGWRTICLPRPGCGNGQLSWANMKPVISQILDDRFVVVFPVDNWGPMTVPESGLLTEA